VVQHRALDSEEAADSGLRTRAVAAYVLREGAIEHRIDKSPLVIGRASGADVVLDGPLVSRRHAQLSDTPQGFVLSDLGSRNGVFVNGRRIGVPVVLEIGDTLTIGENTFALLASAPPPTRRSTTLSDARSIRKPLASHASEDVSVATRRADALQLLGNVVDKALALGRTEEAERLLGNHLVAALSDARAGRTVTPEVARTAALYAVRLATATGKSNWLDFAFRLYAALGSTMPLPVVDEMYTVLRRVPGLDRQLLHAYLEQQRVRPELSPPERFVLQRLEGLERLAAWHPRD